MDNKNNEEDQYDYEEEIEDDYDNEDFYAESDE